MLLKLKMFILNSWKRNPILWKLEEVQMVESLKQSLITVLALLSLEKPFHLLVNVDKGTNLGILTQEHRGKKPIAFLTYLNSLIL
jgi:hypothetical protein